MLCVFKNLLFLGFLPQVANDSEFEEIFVFDNSLMIKFSCVNQYNVQCTLSNGQVVRIKSSYHKVLFLIMPLLIILNQF